jgi:hypothetical protein
MNKTFTKRALLTLALTVVALCLCGSAHATFKTMAQKLPASSNAIVAINVAKLLETPYAKAEWTPNTPEAWVKQPVMIPPGSTRILMASDVQTNTMESVWELSLMEMERVPELQVLAAGEGGNIDRVWDKDAVASPINAYFIPLDKKLLASITPANRSAIAKWLRTPLQPEGNVTSNYIKGVLATLGDKTDIVMAMELEGAFSVPNIRRFLEENDIKEIKTIELDNAARTLGTMLGIKLEMTVDKEVKGRATVDFTRETDGLAPAAKPIMIAVLNAAGMHIDDIDNWTFAASGKQITMEGKVSTPSLRQLLSIVQSPIPAATTTTDKKPAEGGNVPADPAQASQRYYKLICANLDNFRPTSSPSEAATFARATSKRIDQLPILNVDPALVQWGAMVSLKLKQAGGTMAIGQTQMNARVAGIADPSYSTYSYDAGGQYRTDVNPAEAENARRQRRAAALEQKAQAQQQAVQIMTEIGETRPKIRAEMVEKYKVEF